MGIIGFTVVVWVPLLEAVEETLVTLIDGAAFTKSSKNIGAEIPASKLISRASKRKTREKLFQRSIIIKGVASAWRVNQFKFTREAQYPQGGL